MAEKSGEDNVDITALEEQESVQTDEWEADTGDREAEELLGLDGCGGECDGKEAEGEEDEEGEGWQVFELWFSQCWTE